MRISARFATADEAEFAAIAVKRIGDGIFDVSIREQPRQQHRTEAYEPIGFFSNLTSDATLPYTVNAAQTHQPPASATVDIICRPSAAGAVSSALISNGGHDLRGT